MKQLLLNNQAGLVWDLVVSTDSEGQAQLGTIADKEYIPQKTKQLLLTGKGEVFTDTEYGVPWFQEILGKGADLGNIRAILLDVLDNSDVLYVLGVRNTDIKTMDLDNSSRHLIIKDLELTGDSPDDSITVRGISI